MKRMIATALATAALAGTVLAEEVNLRTLAVEDGSGNLVAYSDGSALWATGREADKFFDGNTSTYYDPKSAAWDTWDGYEVSTPCILTRIRYYGRSDQFARVHLTSSLIQGSNSADFSDAVTLHVPNPPKSYGGGSWVEEFVIPKAQSFRYFRIIEQYALANRNTFAGLLHELEFYGVQDASEVSAVEAAQAAGAVAITPSSATVSAQSLENQYPLFANVAIQRPYAEIAVLRAPGEGGPWTFVGSMPNDSSTFADTTCPIGVPCYYRMATAYTDSNGVRTIGGTNETVIYYRRQHLLERDWSDMSHLKSGVSVIVRGGNNWWTGGATLEENAAQAFDGIYNSKYSGLPNFASGSPRTCLGVDFGSDPCYVTSLRMYFNYDNDPNRLTGDVFAGSNESDWYNDGKFTNLTEPMQYNGVRWYTTECTVINEPYRYVFCHNPSYNSWSGELAELQFYGWPSSATASTPVGVRELSVTQGNTPNLSLAWSIDLGDVSAYDIERREDGGAWHTVATSLAAGTTTWTDTSAPYDGTTYEYRVVSRNGGEVAYSKTVDARPYQPGNGIGLYGEWWTGYVTTTGGETLSLVTTNATIDIANASVGNETENLFARWFGKLIAPFAGDFTFEAEADGALYLWIDGNPVLYRNVSSGTINLAVGEHDVTAIWYHKDGASNCRLLWGGCITHEVIPATQLVPVPPRPLPEKWVNARSFDTSAGSLWLSDVKVNADGSFDVAQSGKDLSPYYNGYDFLWQPIKGDFTIEAKIDSLPIAGSWTGRKAGLMVRSSLDATAMMRAYGVKRTDNAFYLVGIHKTTATGQDVREHDKVSGAPLGSYPAAPTWVRLRRKGNVFTCDYKAVDVTKWTKHYEYVDANGEYGETTYVGLSAWGEGDGTYTTMPYYLWRFSEVSLTTPRGFIMVVR